MTGKLFCALFNSKDLDRKAEALRALKKNEEDMPRADINLAIPLKPGGKYQAIIFAGYLDVSAVIWYAYCDETMPLPVAAFELFPDAEKTFKEWAKGIPSHLANGIKKNFIETFTMDLKRLQRDN